MPGNKKHHTEKFRRCVEKVMADGKEESAAYAICTTSLQEAGEPIFEGAEMHHLHLCGATGTVRTEMYDGREHLVVPVVALMEGVIHAVNAETPEFVPLSTLQKAAASWNGRPVVVNHPVKDGKQCSANSPAILESHGIGQIFNSRVEGIKLLQEAWIEKAKTKRLFPDLYAHLEANKPEEVSVGAWVLTGGESGEHKGKKYATSWLDTTGDHLAFLPGGRGACSMEMGCGAHRAASHLVTAESIEPIVFSDDLAAIAKTFTALAGARHSADDVRLIQAVHDHSLSLGATCTPANRAAEHNGSNTGGHKNAAAASAPQLRAACGCQGEKKMSDTNTKKAELIAALVTDKHSGFKEGDEKFLETLEETRLVEFKESAVARAAAEETANKTANESRNLAAKLKIADEKVKVTEERLKAAEQKPTKEQWLEMAPPEIRALLDQEEKRNAEHRTQLVTQLKTAQSEFTEEDLNGMEITMLERLARTVRVPEPDFSGRGVPAPRSAGGAKDEENYAPPNPYEAGIKALQGTNYKH